MLFSQRKRPGLLTILLCGVLSVPAQGQVGQVTAAIGQGTIRHADGHEPAWELGSSIEEGTELQTSADSFAMLFFVSGMGGADIEFDGVIVVEVDENTHIRVQSKRSAIDIHVLRGAIRAFFDSRAHGNYILLSTPLGRMRVTGSKIYASHDLPDQPGSVFGTFDSPCEVLTDPDGPNAQRYEIMQAQKVVVASPDAKAELRDLLQADSDYWDRLPDFHMHAALATRETVTTAYASRSWVGEYVVSAERLEVVAQEASSNIPTQEPIVTSVRVPLLLQAIALAAVARGVSQPQGLREVRDEQFDRPINLGIDDNRGIVIITPVARSTARSERLSRSATARPAVRRRGRR